MVRPVKVTPTQLLKALTPTRVLSAMPSEPVKPSALAKALGVSRATIHRKLEALLLEGLVVRTGEGPTAAYRVPTAAEALAHAEAQRPDGLVRMVLDKRSAWAVRESLELYTRLGIGQLEELRQEVSFEEPGGAFPHEKLDKLDGLVAGFKRCVTGMSPHASFGIYNPKVPAHVSKAWALMRALRHRIAWDQTPSGRLGVWHDEPLLNEDSLPGLSVLSDTPGEDGKPTRYIIELPREAVALIGRTVKVALRVHTNDFQVLLDMVADGTIKHTEKDKVDGPELASAAEFISAMAYLTADGKAQDFNVALSEGDARLLHLVKACEAFIEAKTSVTDAFEPAGRIEISTVTDSPVAFTVDDLPEGMLLNFKGGKYRVIAPRGDDDLLTIIAESSSLQTAVQMARNVQSGSLARNWAL